MRVQMKKSVYLQLTSKMYFTEQFITLSKYYSSGAALKQFLFLISLK